MFETDVDREISAIREAYAEKFNFDLDAIVADLRAKDLADTQRVIRPAPQRTAVATPSASTPELAAQPGPAEPEMSR